MLWRSSHLHCNSARTACRIHYSYTRRLRCLSACTKPRSGISLCFGADGTWCHHPAVKWHSTRVEKNERFSVCSCRYRAVCSCTVCLLCTSHWRSFQPLLWNKKMKVKKKRLKKIKLWGKTKHNSQSVSI